ncbi:exonuclease SbcCD subunit D [Anaerotruncus rubiinfantis]|uniref:exonuclease SbcCD subunit D n=1 Tax=Anaerotruncus rubiinfantis TaxID=1720200 RepID=UPI001899F6B8|nr:exonuclease SbcCD subunit D [Anaerotruncus rubiinfantis]
MKLIHLSDLHLGKRVNEFSMLEDQEYILKKIINAIDDECPDGIIIAGDIYDKSIPSAEAVELFDDFLVSLAKRKLQVFVISGNHDSPERIAFGNRLMDASGIHLSPVYDGNVIPFCLHDDYGEVNIFMLPFVKPANIRRFFPDSGIVSYTDAVRIAIQNMPVNSANRNVLITHQFVMGALRSESEDISVGGSDNIDASVFDEFDYVALGHIHGPQNIGSERVRYSGTPLKYSFSEASHQKSITVVELGEKGCLSVRTVSLTPQRDMAEIKGSYNELTRKSYYENTSYQDDYMHITLTDEEDILDAMGKLRVIYHNLMKLDYDNKRTRHSAEVNGSDAVETKTPFELFAEFYELQNNAPMSEEQSALINQMIEKIWEGEK